MNNEDVFNEFEKQLSGDWEEIKREIEEKEIEEKDRIPKRMDVPSYKDFYNFLYDILINKKTNVNYHKDIYKMLNRILYPSHEEMMPKSFEKIWKLFCDPVEYKIVLSKCNICKNEHEILYKDLDYYDKYFRYRYNLEMERERERERESKINRVFCPNCGLILMHFNNCEILGIFNTKIEKDIPKRSKYMEERGYDIKY